MSQLNRIFSKGRKSILTNSGFHQKWTDKNENKNPRCLLAAGWFSLALQLNEELDAFRSFIPCLFPVFIVSGPSRNYVEWTYALLKIHDSIIRTLSLRVIIDINVLDG